MQARVLLLYKYGTIHKVLVILKKILVLLLIVALFANSLPALADYGEYTESAVYAGFSDKISGCEAIGAFVDYKTLVDNHLTQLLSMNSAERQKLITEILADAGTIYVSEENIDFTDGELAEYLAYAAANVAESKSYLKHYGMSSIADVPMTIDFGSRAIATVSLFRSFLANAYNSGVSDMLIKSGGVGIMLDIEEIASVLNEPDFSVSLMRRNAADLAEDYKTAAKSDLIYQIILSEDKELHNALPDSKILFYSAAEEDRVYCLASDASGVKTKLVSTNYDGDTVTASVNSRRWFGIYKEEFLPVGGFYDVPPDHWAYEYIDYLGASGIVSGNNGRFNPDDNVTREEFVKMLVDALELNPFDAQCSFKDVPETEWYYKYVASAYTCGVINGTDESLFGVGEPVSRQDIAVMTVRALDYKQILLEPVLSHFGYFFDSDSISDYAQDAVMTMYVSGFVSGDEDYRFNPHSPATRAEVAKIIYMLVDYIERI